MRSIGLYVFVTFYCATVLIAFYAGSRFASVVWLSVICGGMLVSARSVHWELRPVILCTVSGAALGLMRLTVLPPAMPMVLSGYLGQTAPLKGTIVAIPDLREVNEKLTVEVRIGNAQTRVLATVPLYPPFHVGDEVRISGTLQRPKPFASDGGRTFAYDQFLRKDGIYAVLPIARAERIGMSKSVWLRLLRALEAAKGVMTRALDSALPEPESALAVGILVGGKQGLGVRLIDEFTTSGMLQIIVLSGFNVMIVASALMRILSRVPKRVAFVIASSSIISFVLLAGAGSSAVRAGLMAGFALAARTFGRRYDVQRVVFVTLFLIAFWNPFTLAYDPGLQFSFIATLGLVIGTPLIAPRLLFLKNATLIELVSTSLAAEVALLPLLLYETGNLSFVSVIANVAAMPAIPFAMSASAVAAALALPLGQISPVLPLVIGIPAYLPLAYVIRIATLSASLPFANRMLNAFPFWIVLASYAALAFLVYKLSRPPRPRSGSLPRPN